MAVRVLADGKIKFSVLTTAPADPSAPTAAELNAGIDASCLVLLENFSWTAADSDRVNEPALCTTVNAEAPGRGNSNLAMQLWRWYDPETGAVDAAADVLFDAVKLKGTTLYGYTRVGGKDYSEDWAEGDIFDYGAEFLTDAPQLPGLTGLIKVSVPCLAQAAWQYGTVAAEDGS